MTHLNLLSICVLTHLNIVPKSRVSLFPCNAVHIIIMFIIICCHSQCTAVSFFRDSVPGTAICQFNVADIERTLDESPQMIPTGNAMEFQRCRSSAMTCTLYSSYRITQLRVDRQVEGINGTTCDVIFVSTG